MPSRTTFSSRSNSRIRSDHVWASSLSVARVCIAAGYLATPFGFVLHELATNAAKYGSLSVPSGTVSVAWTTAMRNNQRILRIVWTETGGPRAVAPAGGGFGHTLIESAIPGARVEPEYRASGLVCTIEVALSETSGDGLQVS